MHPFLPSGLRLRRFLSVVAVVVAVVAGSGMFVASAVAAGGPLVPTMTPTSPTFTDPVTVTATVSGCGNAWTVPPRIFYSVSGPGNYNAQYTTAEETVSADRDTVSASRTIGPLAPGNWNFVVYGNGTCFSASTFSNVINFSVNGPPTAPSNLLTSAGNARATVAWTAPTSNNGSAITSYTVRSSPGGRTCTTGGQTCQVTGLTNGTTYTFTVTATNVYGTGPASAASAPVVPEDRPSPPTGVTATASSGQAAVSWQAAADNGAPVASYLVTSTPENRTCQTSGALSCTVTGLTNGTPYTFVVTATNSAGTSDASSASSAVVPTGGPAPPTNVSAAVGVKAATVSWDASADGGSAVTGYTVTSSPEGKTCSTSGGLSCTVGGLSDGTSYTFTVTATNALGTSSASDPSAPVVTPDAPDAPTQVTASAGLGDAQVNWNAAVDNGSAVTQYVVTSSPDAKTCATTGALSCTVSGLATGTAYTFTVTATNAVGTSAASIPSTAVTTAAVPDAPTGVTASAGDTQAAVAWTSAADNGSALTGYTVTASPGGATCQTASTTCVVTGLNNGVSYTFVVTATNAAGTGAASTPSAAVVPAGLPGAPTRPVASARNASTIVSWLPAPDNGSPISTYTVTADPGGGTCSAGAGGANECTITGLTNGVAYTFTVTAANSVGTGAPSVPTAAVMPNPSEIVISLVTAPGADPRGSHAAVSGTGLLPGSRVHFTVHSAPIDLGSAVVNPFGSFASSVTIPADLSAGDHLIVVDALAADGSVLTQQAAFTVPGNRAGGTGAATGAVTATATGTGTGTDGSDGNTLAMTGMDAAPLVLAGLLLLLFGTTLTSAGRRKGR